MRKFHVGQMVKVIRTTNRHQHLGKICRVIALGFSAYEDFVYVDIERWPGEFEHGSEDQFAPVDDDANKKISWAECAWRPKVTING